MRTTMQTRNMTPSPIHSVIKPGTPPIYCRDNKEKMNLCENYQALKKIGINLDNYFNNRVGMDYAMDSLTPSVTTGTIPVPAQFLQNWLPGFVLIDTAARNIDELAPILTTGSWEDAQVVQMVLEQLGVAVPYSDYGNVNLSDWNPNFNARTVIQFEEGMMVGRLGQDRASRINVDDGAIKREACALNLEIQRNAVGFNGYNSGNNNTYGFLNDPGLPNYQTVANGASGSPHWSTKTFLEITADIRTAISGVRLSSKDRIDPSKVNMTLALATAVVDYMSVTSDFNISVSDWLKTSYPKIRVVSAPELDAANGGANVGYLYADSVPDQSTDGGQTFIQMVPAKFFVLGVEQKAKGYIEDYANATAGIMCKRPYAVYRMSGL